MCLSGVVGCTLLCQPLLRWHASYGFESTEEGGLVGKTATGAHLDRPQVGLAVEQLHGMVHTVGVDKLVERAILRGFDTVGDVGAVGAQGVGHVLQLQVVPQVELFLFHELTDALHQFLVVTCLLFAFLSDRLQA